MKINHVESQRHSSGDTPTFPLVCHSTHFAELTSRGGRKNEEMIYPEVRDPISNSLFVQREHLFTRRHPL
ncbi:hypothetical protein [Bradyrhizobium sp. CAR08]